MCSICITFLLYFKSQVLPSLPGLVEGSRRQDRNSWNGSREQSQFLGFTFCPGKDIQHAAVRNAVEGWHGEVLQTLVIEEK